MITVSELSKAYNTNTLFSNVSFSILPKERVGLVGRNGHGKSTLAKILAGEETSDEGKIDIPSGYKIGYLTQHLKFTENSALEEACTALPLLEGGWQETYLADTILEGLGFTSSMFTQNPQSLSGGFQIRLHLAKLLLSSPNLLILDEPTNYLDIVANRWLKKFLLNWDKELLLITHDRSFMDDVATHILGVHRGKFLKIEGKTEKYYEFIAVRDDLYEKQRQNQLKKIEQTQSYINRFRAKARRASQVQSRIKKLEKEEVLEALNSTKDLEFIFPHQEHKGPWIARIENLFFSYKDDNFLIEDLNFAIKKNEKIGIIGPNGKGKSTLLKLIANELNPNRGSVNLSNQAILGYFGQTNIERLKADATIEQEVSLANIENSFTKVRAICGAMMFSGADALKKIKYLSGGEKSRVLLGKVIAMQSNLLLLDEPTHHLDQESVQSLIDALYEYEGAVVFVSHDERFISEIAEKLIVFDEKTPYLFEGNYEDFLERKGWSFEAKEKVANNKKKEVLKLSKEQNKLLSSLKKQELKLEKDITKLEKEKEEVEKKIINLSSQQKIEELSLATENYNIIKEKIDTLYDELESVNKELVLLN